MFANVSRNAQTPAILDPQVAVLAPAQLLQHLLERREFGTAGDGTTREHADAADPFAPLRPRRERPRPCAAEQRDERPAAGHSITSSARARSVSGTESPSALAVLRFTTNSYLVGACTGRSAGFSPLRMRST